MRELLVTIAAVLCSLLGFALLALSQERHHEHVYHLKRPSVPSHRAQRAIGFITICISLACCIANQGAGFGSLLWAMVQSASAIAVALVLTWRPRLLHRLARGLAIVFFFPSSNPRPTHVPDTADRVS